MYVSLFFVLPIVVWFHKHLSYFICWLFWLAKTVTTTTTTFAPKIHDHGSHCYYETSTLNSIKRMPVKENAA